VFLGGTEAVRRNERGPRVQHQALVVQEERKRDRPMKVRLMRLAVTLGTVAATVLAGGASLRGF
jgi:hypothetical protein